MGPESTSEFTFTGEVVEWRGPAPFHFVRLPVEVGEDVKEAARGLEYWGQVAVEAIIGGHRFTTALFPKDGSYLLPLKAAVRRPTGLEPGEHAEVSMNLRRER